MNPVSEGRRLRRPLQRGLAVCLLFVFLTDLGFHFAESFFTPPESPATPVLLAGHGNTDLDPGCGIPGHSGTRFHHHHFPAVVSQAAPPVPLIVLAKILGSATVETVHSTAVIPIGRAPPVRF